MEEAFRRENERFHQKEREHLKSCWVLLDYSRGLLIVVIIDNKKEMITITEDRENLSQAIKKVRINESHMFFGHLSEKMTMMIAKRLGLCLTEKII
jgi:hypothetical protein